MLGKPSGHRALREPMESRSDLISFGVGVAMCILLSVVDTMGWNK